MKLTINGKQKEYSESLTVQQLLQQLSLSPERVVVELNCKIISPDTHNNTQLKAEDIIELVQFVGGG
ncbi:MAG: sulfur carrier protein ThiS [Thermodesulfobacteriota bacterium]|nr:sulfur carrier protein ThiS [Thermodesulfobacteriota bacterium]